MTVQIASHAAYSTASAKFRNGRKASDSFQICDGDKRAGCVIEIDGKGFEVLSVNGNCLTVKRFAFIDA